VKPSEKNNIAILLRLLGGPWLPDEADEFSPPLV